MPEQAAEHEDLVLQAELHSLYDIYRSSALNKEYYGALLARYQRFNTIVEIAIASTASGSGISGLALWNYDWGKVAWGVLTAVTGFLALSKPFLQFHQRIERYSKLFTGHLDNFLQIHRLVSIIRRERAFDSKSRAAYERAFDRFVQLSREDDPQTDKKLQTKSEEKVHAQIPPDSLWWPESKPPQAPTSATPLTVIEGKTG